jgi:hypothetical protein
MQFHLIYAGDLLRSAGNSSKRTWEKHAIRNFLHGQLKTLWETHPALRYYSNKTVEEPGQLPEKFLNVLAHTHEKAGIGFIPLLTEANGLVCSLDILFLRHDQPGGKEQCRGDIDNRVKTLIDALRVPSDGSEIRKRDGEAPDPSPMYCLMQDDKLITSLKVETDRLLFPMGGNQNEACLVIRVRTENVDPYGSPWELHL